MLSLYSQASLPMFVNVDTVSNAVSKKPLL